MKNVVKAAAIALCFAIVTGCSVNPQTGEREFNRTAIGATVGGVAGGILGAAVGGSEVLWWALLLVLRWVAVLATGWIRELIS
ncbi:hypothetical membrane protein [Pseudomonas veronii 1YdBTEX2]|uniref:Hypothetical membrane protein n=1 Tax=Pseudomonas veronii 1YdBTEX2 TaxID=1295141 RepID=A0A1D3K7N6_PSEVE|nr:hypothetical membrane protein [Pseudomonas veronii 1YdBTEX2]